MDNQPQNVHLRSSGERVRSRMGEPVRSGAPVGVPRGTAVRTGAAVGVPRGTAVRTGVVEGERTGVGVTWETTGTVMATMTMTMA